MSSVPQLVLTYWHSGRQTHQTPKGWISGNAPCCVHNGTNADTRGRGGVIAGADGGVSYSCFNCGFKTSWHPGKTLSYRMRCLLKWLNAPDAEISQAALAALRITDTTDVVPQQLKLHAFDTVDLPKDAVPLEQAASDNRIVPIVEYMSSRQLRLEDYPWHWSSNYKYRSRLLIPYYHNQQVVGWTARSINNSKPRYLVEQPAGYVFNLDQQHWNRKYCVVCEGPIDAIYLQAVALGGSSISPEQATLINQLNKQVIIVPDRDKNGAKLVEQAIQQQWSVSMPEWQPGCNDIGDAVMCYGRLYTLTSIISSTQTSPLKIRLRAKKWFKTT